MIWAVCFWTSVPQGNRKLILRWSLTCTWESLTLDGPLMASPALSTATRKDQTRTTVCYQQPAFHKYLVSQICERIFWIIYSCDYFICLQSLLSSIMESSPTTKTWRSFWQVKHFGIIYPFIHPTNICQYFDHFCFCVQESKGYEFESETDTETIAKLVKYMYDNRESDITFATLVEQVTQQLVNTFSVTLTRGSKGHE